MKNLKNKIGMLLLLITIVTFNLIIGANEKGIRILPISILMGLIIIYLLFLKLTNKGKSIFFKSKVDYLVLFFLLTTTLPFIFKTWASYSDTVEFIMKYFFIYSVYILARNVLINKKNIEITITVTLISSLIPVIFGIDYKSFQIFKGVMEWLNLLYTEDQAFYGTFGYANAQAVYLTLCIFLAIHKIKIHNKKFLKILNIVYIIFALGIICISEARVLICLLGIIFITFSIIKYKEYIIKYKKRIIVVIVGIIYLFTIFLCIVSNTSKPVIKDNENIDKKIIYDFKQGNAYKLELNMSTEYTEKSNKNCKKSFEIEILQLGPYFKESTIAKQSVGKIEEYFTMDFTPTQDSKYIRIKINNIFGGIIKINDAFINGKKQIIEYKYVQNNVGYFLSSFYLGEKSLPQRIYMYKDSLKIAKESPIIGRGGDAWKNLSLAVEDYKVALKECHSYFFELLISYGIIGVLAFYTMIIYFFIKIFKECKRNTEKKLYKLSIALGLLIVLLHAIIDFDMSFILIQISVYIYMAALLYDEEEKVKHIKFTDAFVLLFLIFIFSIYVKADISKYLINGSAEKYYVSTYNKTYYHEKIKQNLSNNDMNTLKELQDFMIKEPYYSSQTSNYKYYFKILLFNVNNLSNEELENYLKFGLDNLEKVKFRTPMYYETVIKRAQMIKDIIDSYCNFIYNNDLQEKKLIISNAVQQLKQILNKEFELNMKNMDDYEKTDYSELMLNIIKQKYKEIINSIK